MRRLLVSAVASLAMLAGIGAVATTASARGESPAGTASAAATCKVTWGSLPESNGNMSTRPITNVRAGRHTCFDRLVVDLAAPPAGAPAGRLGYDVRYAAVFTEGEGNRVPLAGNADLRIIVRAPTNDIVTGRSTYDPRDENHIVNVGGFSTFRQVAFAGSFEGQTTIGLGVRARLPFRVLILQGPGTGARLVIDVAHHW
jgi:hypothetical protein